MVDVAGGGAVVDTVAPAVCHARLIRQGDGRLSGFGINGDGVDVPVERVSTFHDGRPKTEPRSNAILHGSA